MMINGKNIKEAMLKNSWILIIPCFINAAIARSDGGIEIQPRQTSISLSQRDNRVCTAGSQNASSFQSNVPGYLLVTEVLDGWGGESGSTEYSIQFSSGGQAAAGSSESNTYGAQTGFIFAVQIKRGDVNQSGVIEVGDVVYLINYLYQGGGKPIPQETGDSNCDGAIDVGDVIYLINYLFRQGLPPCGG